jgi:hypothetical protein
VESNSGAVTRSRKLCMLWRARQRSKVQKAAATRKSFNDLKINLKMTTSHWNVMKYVMKCHEMSWNDMKCIKIYHNVKNCETLKQGNNFQRAFFSSACSSHVPRKGSFWRQHDKDRERLPHGFLDPAVLRVNDRNSYNDNSK